ncbi:Transcriptional regulator, Mar family [Pediococcus damnosus]|uniref:MarR family winged helix-turn-helix transcriptional regulator n=1 Tax=Pediococcus damnosus TaxID=51663 RepID=UPI00078DBE0C|nr:MarR family transcriptional regulator [Pediococcus damnosus]AMV60393.1 Transcriptional regulator, Mar family [Pediococcus damnosus]AMV64643.1 Transcriptional regulator, Mar family [Pediococcus damnosus]
METESTSSDIFAKFFQTFAQVISQSRSLDEFGLTNLQATTLRNAYQHSGITMTQLAQSVGITRPQLTRIVNTLEERGLVHRHHNEKNRRVINVQQTQKGKRIIKKHMELIQSRIQRLVGSLDANDQEALIHHLKESTRLIEKAGFVKTEIEKK